MTSKASDAGVRIAVAAAALSAAAATLGFLAGAWSMSRTEEREERKRARRRRDRLCECGVILPVGCTPEELERHRNSNRHRKNMELISKFCEIVVCEEIGEYRAAAQYFIRDTHHVLEVGCHVGGTSKVLAACGAKLMCIDQQPDLIAEAKDKYPNIKFEICDAFDAQRLLGLAKEIAPERFHAVFIDISGSRDINTVIRMVDLMDNILKPKLIVVKSQAMKRLIWKSKNWIHHPAQEELW